MSKNFKAIPFQIEAVDNIVKIFDDNPKARILLQSPTGTGKTVMARMTILNTELHKVLLKNKSRSTIRIIFKAHMSRLLTQARRQFADPLVSEKNVQYWIDQDSGVGEESTTPIEISFQMIGEKLPENADIDLIFYDEYHHEACNTIQEFLGTAGMIPSIGMTATPERGDNCLIKFDHKVEPITRRAAVEQGYICQSDIITIVDSSDKNKVGLVQDVLREFSHEMGQTMIFVRTKKEIDIVVNFINNQLNNGVARGCGDNIDIDPLLDEFSDGGFKYIVSCNKISEGVDVKGATDIIIAKNVGSPIDLNQMIGRVARNDVPDCRIWEFCNSLSAHNLSAVDIVGIPKTHRLVNKVNGEFVVRDFM